MPESSQNNKLLDFVWKISSWHFHPNMSYIRPESFYLLHPCSRGCRSYSPAWRSAYL